MLYEVITTYTPCCGLLYIFAPQVGNIQTLLKVIGYSQQLLFLKMRRLDLQADG